MKYIFSILLVITASNSQSRIGDFQSISSFAHVRSALFFDNLLFGISQSGLISLNTVDGSFETVSIDNGLSYLGLTHIHKDVEDNLWIGSKKAIQVWDPQKKVLINKFQLDIEDLSGFINYKNFIYAAVKINGLWGILEFRYVDEKVYFRDFYQRSDLENILKISHFDNNVFLLSSNGLISGNPFQNHISAWSNPVNLNNETPIDIHQSKESLYILSSNSIYRFTIERTLETIKDNYDFSKMKGIMASNEDIFTFSDTSIFQILDGEVSPIYSDQNLQINSIIKGDNYLWTATSFGFGRLNNNTYNSFIYNQPIINDPDAIEIYNNTLIMVNKQGISIDGWTNYITSKPPRSISNKFQISSIPYNFGEKISKSLILEDLLFLSLNSSQTAGIVSLDINNQFSIVSKYFTYIDQDTTNLKFNVGDMVFDRQNNLWAISLDNLSYPLSVFSKNQTIHLSDRLPKNNIIDGSKSIVVDNYNRIWMSSFSGLLMYNYSGDVLNPKNEEWVNVPIIDGVNRRALNYKVSSDNTLWIITSYGLIYKKLRAQADQPVAETGPLTSSGSINPYFQNIPFDQSSRIYFDPSGNLWVTSNNEGIFVLDTQNEYWPSSNGINSSNSKLLSNNISDIKFSSEDGLVFISTDLGVSKLKIPFKSEIKKTNTITIFPSPFVIPSNRPMVIDGVPQKSSIQIMSLNGNKIKTLSPSNMNGYQATWNGMDEDGAYVGSGIYLVLIINKKHNTSSIEKIAVIKN